MALSHAQSLRSKTTLKHGMPESKVIQFAAVESLHCGSLNVHRRFRVPFPIEHDGQLGLARCWAHATRTCVRQGNIASFEEPPPSTKGELFLQASFGFAFLKFGLRKILSPLQLFPYGG